MDQTDLNISENSGDGGQKDYSGRFKPIRMIGDIISNKTKTVYLLDGIMFPGNGGSIIRTTSILNNAEIIFASIDKKRYDEIYDTLKDCDCPKDGSRSKFTRLQSFVTDRKKNNCKFYFRYSYSNFVKKAIHTSTGHNNYTNVYCDYEEDSCYHLEEIISLFRQDGYTIFCLEDYHDSNLYHRNLNVEKAVFILGNERVGVSSLVKEKIEKGEIIPISIPSAIQESSSLNVSTAATVVASERLRHIKFK